ncbi:MAG: AI-2E family transporter [Gemmataceae bacterium]|nr:AI-2E family transporter [Gemmataceae bacterium]
MTPAPEPPGSPAPDPAAAHHRPRRRVLLALPAVASVLVIAAAGWFLLRELAPVLRPLLTAVFLAYALMPYHSRLRKRMPGVVSLVLLAVVTAGVLVGLALVVSASVVGLSEELPDLEKRAVVLADRGEEVLAAQAPWLVAKPEDGRKLEERLAAAAGRAARPLLNAAAEALAEAAVVGLYLLFLLLTAAGAPDRVRRAYSPARAEEILQVAGEVNAAVVSYVRAKVVSSLLLAVPVALVLAGFGVRFAVLWGVLTFLCNFIPYLGSVVAYSLPVGFAVLQLEPGWRPVAVAAVVLGCHLGSASVVEPLVLGRAVGLSPLVILVSLGFWGLLWGVPGMFLAVPLTVVGVIVMGHFPATRPVAKLLSEG